MRGRAWLPVLALLAVVTAGCGSAPVPVVPTARATVPKLPGAELITPASAPPPAVDTCDADATLRPGARPAPGAMPAGSPMAAIVANGKLRVGVDQNTNLFGFRDPATGELRGFDIDLAREIALDLFGDRNRVEFRSVTAADRIKALTEHKVDMIVRTFTVTCDRRRDVDFSAVYYRAIGRVAVLASSGITGSAGLSGKRLCVARGTTAYSELSKMPWAATALVVATNTDCLVALQQGQVDSIATDEAILYGLAEEEPNLRIVGDPISSGRYAVGLPLGQPDLVRFVNGVLERVRTDGTWQRLYQNHLAVLGPAPAPPEPKYTA